MASLKVLIYLSVFSVDDDRMNGMY